jgi:hypothetical protein
MGSLLRAPSPAMRLWRAAVRPASSVGGVGALLHPARPRVMARAVAARIAREVERFLEAYIDPLFREEHLLQNTVNQGTGIRCEAFAQSFILERTGFSILLNKTKGKMEGDWVSWLGKARTVRADGNLIRGEGIHLGKRISCRSKCRSMLEISTPAPNTNLEVEL